MASLFSQFSFPGKLRRSLRLIGILLFAIALIIIVVRLGGNIRQVGILNWNYRTIYLPLACLSTLLMLTAMSYGWKQAINYAGGELGFLSGHQIYYRTNILRYLPGGIWNFPGRAYLARQAGISLQVFQIGTFYEFFFLLSSGVIVTLMMLGIKLKNPTFYVADFVISAGIIFIASKFKRRVFKSDLTSRNEDEKTLWFRQEMHLLLIYVVVWAAFSIAVISLFQVVPGAEKPSVINIVTSNIVSWATGFFSFAPAGLGVRELGFAELMGSQFAAQAVLVSTSERILELLFELLFWLMSFNRRSV